LRPLQFKVCLKVLFVENGIKESILLEVMLLEEFNNSGGITMKER